MDKLKLLWTDIGGVQWKGKGIIEAWREEMSRRDWDIETDPAKWRECDLVFYGSDSQLEDSREALGNKPTILYFWGWMPAKLLDRNFQAIVVEQLKMMVRCTRILVPSLGTMDQVADFGLPSHLCLPGVDSRLLDWGYGVPCQRKSQVMFLSRLALHKHLDALIQAVSLIRPCPDLLVVGPGDKAPYIKMARELGVPARFEDLDDQEKVEQLRASSVLVHPSSYEGFGLPPLEALYCGTPVIAFDIPQLRWLLQEDAYYFSSVEGLAQTVGYILENPKEAQAKANHGSERIRDSLTLGHACDRLWPHIYQVHKEFWAYQLRVHPDKWREIYNEEHKRNWAYSVERLSPEWFRHWRMKYVLSEVMGPRVLDMAAGAGTYTIKLALEGYDVTWNDISDEALHQAETLSEKFGVKEKISFHRGDCTKLPLPDSSFDSIWAGEILEHLPEPYKVIQEALRLLKPKGKLIMSTPIGHHHYDPYHMGPAEGGWDDESLGKLLRPWRKLVTKLDKIAEQGADPSCYLVVLEKL